MDGGYVGGLQAALPDPVLSLLLQGTLSIRGREWERDRDREGEHRWRDGMMNMRNRGDRDGRAQLGGLLD